MPSSLDLFILALIMKGTTTPYSINQQAGISLGASVPALRRLQKRGWVKNGRAGERNRQEFAVTPLARKGFRAAFDSQVDIHLSSHTTLESSLRLVILALKRRKKAVAIALLEAALRSRKRPGAPEPTTKTPPGMGKTLVEVTSSLEQARQQSELEFLRLFLRRVKR